MPSFSLTSRKAYVELRVGKSWRHTYSSCVAESKTRSLGETSHKPWSRCASVWNLWMIYELLSWAISLLLSFGHGLTFFWNTLDLHVSTFLLFFSFFFEYLGLHVSTFFLTSPCPFNFQCRSWQKYVECTWSWSWEYEMHLSKGSQQFDKAQRDNKLHM